MFVAGVVTKIEGFPSVLTFFEENTKQHRPRHLDHRGAGEWSIKMEFLSEIV